MDLDKCLGCGPCKDYLDTEIPKDLLDQILQAATHAYSPANLQNWDFVVVDDPAVKAKITTATKDQKWINQAPVLIVICNNNSRVKQFFPAKGDVYSEQAVAAAAQVMLLKAEELGLGSCWVAGFDEKKVGRILNLPIGVIARMIITLGYSEFTTKNPDPTSIVQVTHYNEYGNKATVSNFNLSSTTKKIESKLKKKAKKLKKILK